MLIREGYRQSRVILRVRLMIISRAHRDEHAATDSVQQQPVVFAGRPACQSGGMAVTHHDEVDVQIFCEKRNLIQMAPPDGEVPGCMDATRCELPPVPVAKSLAALSTMSKGRRR